MAYTMKAGTGKETVFGWAYCQIIEDRESVTFLATKSRNIALGIASNKPGVVWCRYYTIVDGNKVICC